MRVPGPVERVRTRLEREAPVEVQQFLPRGFERFGKVLLLRLPEEARPYFPVIGRAYLEELGLTCVLRHTGAVAGELRRPSLERIAGGEAEAEIQEHGVRYRFDASQILFSRGNKEERARAGSLVQPEEQVVDLFAGIGYFTIPAARAHPSVRVRAVELNPVSYHYLLENVQANGVGEQVLATLGDNRAVELPAGAADRVFLGFLPSSLPWVARGVELLRPEGGALHVHLLAERRAPLSQAEAAVTAELERAGSRVLRVRAHRVKTYGPGSDHLVVDGTVAGPARPG
jgi:tRNA wybutosine-synthesizing protein 2